ncbi:hypothetical protein ASD54_22495 [Rhizobium sp. Root149]|nr:hypothetical protein ASD54_22495 [Rhizobium sp. Root149]
MSALYRVVMGNVSDMKCCVGKTLHHRSLDIFFAGFWFEPFQGEDDLEQVGQVRERKRRSFV